MECIDLGSGFGQKGRMIFDGVWVVSIDPKNRIVDAVADAVSSQSIRHLHYAAHTQRPQGGVVEGGRTADVRDSDAGGSIISPSCCGMFGTLQAGGATGGCYAPLLFLLKMVTGFLIQQALFATTISPQSSGRRGLP